VFKEIVQKIKITGYLLSPSISRSRKKDISIFVNGRYIRNYQLVQAVIDGYHSFMMVGKYPIAFIHLEMDSSLLDVNVHPQKYEVKFVNESILSYHIETFVKDALLKKTHPIPENIKVIHKNEAETYTPQAMLFGEHYIEEQELPFKEKKEIDMNKIPDMDYVGVFSGTYLLFQNEEGLYLMDQHAAAERIRYEHYFLSLAKPNPAVKNLLITKELSLTKEDKEVIQNHLIEFNSFGFSFNQSLELIALPVWLLDSEIEIAIEQMISMLTEKNKIDLSILRDTLAKDISCKGAIKANKSLSLLEVQALLKKLKACDNPYTCPHGRPTMIKLTHHDIERMFKRVL
ncbi:MAG: hypothetical protein Q7J85_08775, partial [Bacillota bacterium]|nr:hypothetical protein [Bacillota bacterium]